MNSEDPIACVRLAACICGKDGVISETELNEMVKVLSMRFPEFSFDLFEKAIDDFFMSDAQIEEFLDVIENEELRIFTLKLSELSEVVLF
jgi:hypothetical protein